MNEKFFSLPKEKQNRIMNAGFRIFSESSYKKSPVSEIAETAGISKALLFHYFKNKKELYLYLWNVAAKITQKQLEEEKCFDSDNLFDMMEHGIYLKTKIISKYPHMSNFLVRAYYEKDSEISSIIQKSYKKIMGNRTEKLLDSLNPDDFIPGLDLHMMYRDMYLASEGYMWEMLQKGDIDAKQIEEDSLKLLEFWRTVYENPNKKEK